LKADKAISHLLDADVLVKLAAIARGEQ